MNKRECTEKQKRHRVQNSTRKMILQNSTFANSSNLKPEHTFTNAEDIITKLLYIVIAFVNFAGNFVLIFVIWKQKRIHNTVNLLLLNLALADIVSGIAIFPYLFIKGRSDIICGIKDGLPIFHAASMVNFLTLGLLSLSRYMLINHPTRPKWRIRKRSVKWLALCTWLTGTILVIPNVVLSRYSQSTRICEYHWLNGFASKLAFVVTNVIAGTALFALIFTYFSTVYTLWFRPTARRLTRSNSISSTQSSRKRVSILLGMLIVAFLVCWVPFTVYWVLSAGLDYFPDTMEGYIEKTRLKRYTVLVAFLNTLSDPIFYALGNRQIREEAVRALKSSKATSADQTVIAFE
ncbi:substance-K receptor-like [Rhopilema esculentum]|uniref:substance-K receptor-like n=1 Tax=Rhopilema esculentum TaxID=499914 RepID=UPI0031E3BDC3